MQVRLGSERVENRCGLSNCLFGVPNIDILTRIDVEGLHDPAIER